MCLNLRPLCDVIAQHLRRNGSNFSLLTLMHINTQQNVYRDIIGHIHTVWYLSVLTLICSTKETKQRVELMMEKSEVVDVLQQFGHLLQEEKHLSEQLNGQVSADRYCKVCIEKEIICANPNCTFLVFQQPKWGFTGEEWTFHNQDQKSYCWDCSSETTSGRGQGS